MKTTLAALEKHCKGEHLAKKPLSCIQIIRTTLAENMQKRSRAKQTAPKLLQPVASATHPQRTAETEQKCADEKKATAVKQLL